MWIHAFYPCLPSYLNVIKWKSDTDKNTCGWWGQRTSDHHTHQPTKLISVTRGKEARLAAASQHQPQINYNQLVRNVFQHHADLRRVSGCFAVMSAKHGQFHMSHTVFKRQYQNEQFEHRVFSHIRQCITFHICPTIISSSNLSMCR